MQIGGSLSLAVKSPQIFREACAMLAVCHRERQEVNRAIDWYRQAIDAGATDFIVKPFDAKALPDPAAYPDADIVVLDHAVTSTLHADGRVEHRDMQRT